MIIRKNKVNTYVFSTEGYNAKNNFSLFFGILGVGVEIARLIKELKKVA